MFQRCSALEDTSVRITKMNNKTKALRYADNVSLIS